MSEPLPIGIEANSHRFGSGVARYVGGLIGALAERDDVEISALVSKDQATPGHVRRFEVSRLLPAARRYGIWEDDLRRRLELRHLRDQVVHSPGALPAGGHRTGWVQTLHDCIPLTSSDPELKVIRQWMRRAIPRYQSADAIVAISRHSANQGIELMGLDPRRIEVIHHGIDAQFTPAGDRFRHPRRYLLVVAEYQQRKGFSHALEVISELAERNIDIDLVLVGRVAANYQSQAARLMAQCRAPERVHQLGYVDDLAALYRGAYLTLIPSRDEGFGFVAAESMACGTPVVAFDNSSLPEVIGPAGILVNDGNNAAMTAAVIQLVDSVSMRGDLVGESLLRAQEFDWKLSAQHHMDVYRSVADRLHR